MLMDRIAEVRRFDHVVLLVAAQAVLRPERGGELHVAARAQRIERMRQVPRDRGRMRKQSDAPAFERRAQCGFGEEPVDAEFHDRLRCGKLERKAIGMMEIRASRRMLRAPSRRGRRSASSITAERPSRQTRILRQVRQPLQVERGLQDIEVRGRLHLDERRADLVSHTHPASVAVERIGCPLRRGREIEFVVRVS